MSEVDNPISRAILLLAALAACGIVFASPGPGVQLDTFRCGRHVIEVGVDSFVLLDKCGDPDYRQVVSVNRFGDEEIARAGNRALRFRDTVTVVTEAWVYKQGRGRIPKVLTVSGGVLTDIRLSQRLR